MSTTRSSHKNEEDPLEGARGVFIWPLVCLLIWVAFFAALGLLK